APFLAEPQVVRAEPGTLALPEPAEGVDAYAWAQNETSTGVIAPVRRVSEDALMLVDGTSAAGGVRTDVSQPDAYYFAPQKAFGSAGGLWLAVLSPAALARIAELGQRWAGGSPALAGAGRNPR